jgi:heavy metal translocating P-type ATPase
MTHDNSLEDRVPGQDLLRVALVALAAAAVWFRVWEPLPRVSVIGLLATIAGGWPLFKEALENLLERKMTMELSMTIAILAALAIGEFFTALVIAGFVLAAEILEEMTVSRGRKAIGDLLEYLPHDVTVRRDGALVVLPIDQLRVGDLVIVKPGSRLPVDGVVVSGQSFVDQAAITGEPMPAEKMPGSRIYAGTINQSGALEVEAERLGRDTNFGRIVEAVETAERSRAPIQRTADRLAGYLVYFALIASAITFLVTRNVRSSISVIIVAGACGVAAGTPLAILGGIGRAGRLGAIIKGGLYLEVLARVDTVAFDKTGTLTFGVPEVQELFPAPGVDESDLLALAAGPERVSEHPIAKALLAKAEALSLHVSDPDQFSYVPGKGVRALVDGHDILIGSRSLLETNHILASPPPSQNSETEVLVACDGRYLGAIHVADRGPSGGESRSCCFAQDGD